MRTTKPGKANKKPTAVDIAKARTDWQAVASDRATEIADLHDQIDGLQASLGERRKERDTFSQQLAAMTERRDELQVLRADALDMLRHMQAEALFWRGVAAGIDPDKAAAAELARRGQRFGDLAERMDAGMDATDQKTRRPGIYSHKNFVAGEFVDPYRKGRT